MRIPVYLTLTGNYREDLRHISITLAQIEEGIEPRLEADLLEAAYFMMWLAKGFVRVDTGSLQKSIRVEHIARLAVRVRAGGYIVNPKTGRLVDYALYQEHYHPYLHPAWNATQKFVTARVQASMEYLASV